MPGESVGAFPHSYQGEVIGPRLLLQDVKAHIALLSPHFFGGRFEQRLGFVFARRRNIHMRDDNESSLARPSRIANAERLMRPLIEGTLVDSLQLRAQLTGMIAGFMRFERRIALPGFDNDETMRTAHLLECLDM